MTEEKNFVIFVHGLFSTTLLKGNDIVYPIELDNIIKIYIKNLYNNFIKNIISKKDVKINNEDNDILDMCINKILDKNLKPGTLLSHYDKITNLIKKICGKNYYIFTYDWRNDINNIIENFHTEINKLEIENKNITIIGHSVGGLIAYKYVNQENKYSSENFNKINKIICIGSPIQGSNKALSTIFGLYKDFFLNSEEIKSIISNNVIQSIFQLFPSGIHNLFFYNDTKLLLKQDDYKKVLYKYGFNDNFLNVSIDFRKEMNNIEENKNVNMLFITGIYPKKPMCVGFTLDNSLENIKCIYDYGAGDGTVLINESTPFISKNFRQRFVIGKHKYLTEYDETLSIIESEISYKEYSNVHIVSNIINREKNKDKKILEFMLFLNKNNNKYLIKDFIGEKITFSNKTHNQDITRTINQSKKFNIFNFKTDFKYGILKIKNGYFTYYLNNITNEDEKEINMEINKLEEEEDNKENKDIKNIKDNKDKDNIDVIYLKHVYIDLQQLNLNEYLI